MKKFGKIFLLTLVVVGLVISFVGCAIAGGSTDDLDGTKTEFLWDTTNESTTDYKRFYKSFGGVNPKEVNHATVEIVAENPKDGWSGMVFGLESKTNTEENNKKYDNFFVLAMKVGTDNKAYYYLSFFKDVDPKDIESAPSFGTEIMLINSDIIPNSVGIYPSPEGKLTACVKVEVSETTNLIVKAGPDKDNLVVVDTIDVSNIEGLSKDSDGNYTIPASYSMKSAKAKIGAYGQLSKADKDNPRRVAKTTFKVIDSDPAPENLCAVEE